MRLRTRLAAILALGILDCESADNVSEVTQMNDGGNESIDGGNEVDSGTPGVDGDLYAEWFADYNQGQDTTYLDNSGMAYEEGDANPYPTAPSHTFIETLPMGPSQETYSTSTCRPTWQGQPRLRCTFMAAAFPVGTRPRSTRTRPTSPPILPTASRWQASTTAMALDMRGRRKVQPYPMAYVMGRMWRRKDYVFRDGARAIQYIAIVPQLEHRSSNCRLGSSAGGQIVMWIATTPNLAVAGHRPCPARGQPRAGRRAHDLSSERTE